MFVPFVVPHTWSSVCRFRLAAAFHDAGMGASEYAQHMIAQAPPSRYALFVLGSLVVHVLFVCFVIVLSCANDLTLQRAASRDDASRPAPVHGTAATRTDRFLPSPTRCSQCAAVVTSATRARVKAALSLWL